MDEVCITSTNGPSVEMVHVWNIRTGVLLHSWKGNKSLGCVLLKQPSSEASVLLAAQSDRPLVHGWGLNKAPIAFKHVVPEQLSCLAVSHSGQYVVGGGQSGRIYLWHYATGILVKMWDAHYKQITALAWTVDDHRLYSASDDTMMHAWNLNALLDISAASVSPAASFAGHSLPITGIHVAMLLGPVARITTCSMDKSCKVWEPSGHCVATIAFPRSLSCLVLDIAQVYLYAGTFDGPIFRTNLYATPDEKAFVLEKHAAKVTGLAFAKDETLLVSSSTDGTCSVWDPSSRACLRTFSQLKGEATSCVVVDWEPHATLYPPPPQGLAKYPETAEDQASRMVAPLDAVAKKRHVLDIKRVAALALKLDSADPGSGGAAILQDLDRVRSQNQELRKLNDELFKALI
ncbi:hypothetical protein HDV03_003261 [Kappamyces sp. JEL0829]|nr:hypothetical protein HDV03_003261 [Kappamyces sp. JEL0829]